MSKDFASWCRANGGRFTDGEVRECATDEWKIEIGRSEARFYGSQTADPISVTSELVQPE